MDEMMEKSEAPDDGKNNRVNIKFHKSTFDNIPEERRNKVFDVAVSEFASNGYSATNINVIAEKAGVSIGSMYNYFESKEALFLMIIQNGINDLEAALNDVEKDGGNVFELLEHLLRIAKDYAEKNPQMLQIYLDATSQGLSGMSGKLSRQIEEITFDLYIRLIEKAKLDGTIGKDVDSELAAFFIDNLVVMLQFSFSVDYYKERMKIFLGPDTLNHFERISKGMTGLLKNALTIYNEKRN